MYDVASLPKYIIVVHCWGWLKPHPTTHYLEICHILFHLITLDLFHLTFDLICILKAL